MHHEKLASCVNYFVWNCLTCFSNTKIGSVTSFSILFNFQGPVRRSLAADDLIILPQKRFFVKLYFFEAFELSELGSFSTSQCQLVFLNVYWFFSKASCRGFRSHSFVSALDRSHAKSSPFRELLQILFYGNSATGNALLYISLVCGLLQGASAGRTLFFTMLHRFPHEASGIRHQHGSGSDAAHPGIVPIFCAGMPYKHARKQCHFPACFPIFAV